jgi:predicted transglutaminase-like cysteine proteinase
LQLSTSWDKRGSSLATGAQLHTIEIQNKGLKKYLCTIVLQQLNQTLAPIKHTRACSSYPSSAALTTKQAHMVHIQPSTETNQPRQPVFLEKIEQKPVCAKRAKQVAMIAVTRKERHRK